MCLQISTDQKVGGSSPSERAMYPQVRVMRGLVRDRPGYGLEAGLPQLLSDLVNPGQRGPPLVQIVVAGVHVGRLLDKRCRARGDSLRADRLVACLGSDMSPVPPASAWPPSLA
jgi:hypothetical protein